MTRFNYKNKPKNKGFVDIYGIHSVNAALKNTKRQHQKLVINHANRRIVTEKVEKLVKDIVELSNKEMFKLYGSEHNHQGIVLTTSSLIQPSLERILFESKNKKIEVILMLDQVTDPNNIGSIMRSCSLFNCNTIIVSKNNAPDITPSMTKTASGALEIVNYLRVTNLSRTILNFKKNNFWIYGFDNNKNNYSNNNFEIENKMFICFWF